MARAVEEGAAGVQGTEVRLRRIPELMEARRTRIARFALAVKWLCAEGPHGLQAEIKTYRAA